MGVNIAMVFILFWRKILLIDAFYVSWKIIAIIKLLSVFKLFINTWKTAHMRPFLNAYCIR